MYIDYAYYQTIYGTEIDETAFNRYVWDACRRIDTATTGIDNVKKLSVAFPTDANDIDTVKRCVCELVHLSYQIEAAKEAAELSRGYITTDDGVQAKVIASRSSGSESISYSTSGSTGSATLIDKALADSNVQERLYKDTLRVFLSGITDANGVNLLYMGRYPGV